MKHRFCLGLLFLALIAAAKVSPAAPDTYVDADATGSNNGLSWGDAYTSLVRAVQDASTGYEIWVAEGVYKPGANRGDSFGLVHQGWLYGGFEGDESALSERDWLAHRTVLSGDLSGNDTANWGNRGDNAIHVIKDTAFINDCGIDGFIVYGGNADQVGAWDEGGRGGGIYTEGTRSLTVSNCVFAGNSAITGGAIFFQQNRLRTRVMSCTFSGNRATEASNDYGSGAIGVRGRGAGDSLLVERCAFAGNTAMDSLGGAFYSTSWGCPVEFINCLFAGNASGYEAGFGPEGGAVYIKDFQGGLTNCTFYANDPYSVTIKGCTGTVRNCVLWGAMDAELNVHPGGTSGVEPLYSDIDQDGYAGNGNIRLDPMFAGGPSAAWTAAGTFDPGTGLSTLTRAGAGWTAGQHAGSTVNPDTAQDLQLCVLGNSATALYVWGDAASLAASGDTFQIYDLGLQQGSPCADHGTSEGAPVDDIAGLTRPHWYGYDMGAYERGGHPYAAEVLYVDQDATAGANNGFSWADAFTDLYEALGSIGHGKDLWVAEGVYTPASPRTNSFRLVAGTGVFGGFAGNETALDQRNILANPTVLSGDLSGNDGPAFAGRADNSQTVAVGAPEAELDGFFIRGGYADAGTAAFMADSCGGGMYNRNADTTVRNCFFADNYAAQEGGAVFNWESSPTFEDCVFSGNAALEKSGAAGGLRNPTAPVFERCIFTGNVCTGGEGGGVLNSYIPTGRPDRQWTVHFTNCLFAGNDAVLDGLGADGVALRRTFTNATVANCTFGGHGDVALDQKECNEPSVVRNSILWGNGVQLAEHAQAFDISFCDVDEDGFLGNGNIRRDPGWAGVESGTWNGAPAYDRDTGSTVLRDTTAGWTANEHTRKSVSVDTNTALQFFVLSNTATELTVLGDATTLAANGDPYGIFDYHLGTGSPCSDTATDEGAPTDDLDGLARPQDYGYDMGAFERGGQHYPQRQLYVDLDATGGANNGFSWADAFTDLYTAIDTVGVGKDLWVAEGVYRPGNDRTNSFRPKLRMNLYGGFAGDESVLTGRNWRVNFTVMSGDLNGDDAPDFASRSDNSQTVLDGQDESIVDGFVVRGGYAEVDTGYLFLADGCGGGMYCDQVEPTVRNCVFTDNYSAQEGAAVYCSACSPTFEDCVFSGNRAAKRSAGVGGIFNATEPTLRRCVFGANESLGTEYGGGVSCFEHIASRPERQWTANFVNCLFAGNHTRKTFPGASALALRFTYTAALLENCTFSGHHPMAIDQKDCNEDTVIHNCIFWDNTEGMHLWGGDFDVTYSLVQDAAFAGANNNIMVNPRFVTGRGGSWTQAGAYDPNTGISRLVDSGTSWAGNEHLGRLVNPASNQRLQFVVISNATSSLFVWGDCSGIASNGASYRIHDYHVDGWSTCIDEGDPASDWSNEPDYPAGHINMGAYGNTPEAAVTNPPPPVFTGGSLFVR
ncbi:right-handed parallel beta-helix repeat-containing protein [Verrucomicrobiota bacterium]